MKRILFISLLILVLASAVFTAYLVKSDTILLRNPVLIQKDAVITWALGEVHYRVSEAGEWQNAIVGNHLKMGYEIKTGKASLTDIRLHSNTAIRLTENSCLKLDYVSVRKLIVNIQEGSLLGKFKKIFEGHHINIKTPTTIASVRGTELAVTVGKSVESPEEPAETSKKTDKDTAEAAPVENPFTTVFTLSGIIEVIKPGYDDQSVLLANRKKVTVSQNDPPGDPEEMNEEDIQNVQSALNSLHFNEVLLITDKIYFKTGSAKILPESYPELDKVVEILRKRDEKIQIEGHTDDIGADYRNQALSFRRASSIQDYLISRGVEPKQLSIEGYGESKPIASNKTREGRAMNRRVEFIIMEE